MKSGLDAMPLFLLDDLLSNFCKLLIIYNLRGPRTESPGMWQIYEDQFQKGL